MKTEEPCLRGAVSLTVKHVLAECRKYEQERLIPSHISEALSPGPNRHPKDR